MGSEYKFLKNPFRDFMMRSMLYNVNILDKEYMVNIQNSFIMILGSILDDKTDITYLDFKLTGKPNNIKILGKNSISALWLSGIFPPNVGNIINKSTFVIGNKTYKYNKKTHKLTYKIKNG